MFSTKSKSKPAVVVRDFDKLLTEAVAFRLHGKVHKLNPITVQEFWRFSESMVRMQKLAEQADVTAKELIEGYLTVFQSVCPSMTLKDVEDMSQPQVGALLQLVIDTIQGASQLEDYDFEKKNPKTQEKSLQ